MTSDNDDTDPTLPVIDHARAPEVIDALLPPDERQAGCLVFLVLDREGRLIAPFVVDDPTTEVARGSKVRALGHLFTSFVGEFGGEIRSVAFGRGRSGSLRLRDTDREWHQLVLQAATCSGVTILGAWLATDAGVRAYPPPLSDDLIRTIPA